jgi:hypothetical protein
MNSSIASLLMVLGLWLSLVSFCCSDTSRSGDSKTLTPAQRAEAQAGKDKACNTVDRLQTAGAFTKVEAGYSSVTHAYVDRAFFSIPVDAKESAMKAVALCHIDLEKKNQLGLVVIHDGYSGKQIGTYDFASGLDLE